MTNPAEFREGVECACGEDIEHYDRKHRRWRCIGCGNYAEMPVSTTVKPENMPYSVGALKE